MKGRFELLLAGSGGQGLVSSGIMLGEAAILEGKNVVQTASYGIAQRGGLSMAEVIMDEEEIIFQQVEQPDLMLALNEEAMEMCLQRFPGALTVYDTTLINTTRESGDADSVKRSPALQSNFADRKETELPPANKYVPASRGIAGRSCGFPFTAMATGLGLAASANLIAIGVLIALTGLVRPESMEEIVQERYSRKSCEINLKALHMGIGLLESQGWRFSSL